MRLPYLQVTQETWSNARALAGVLVISRGDAFALLCDLWAWALDLGDHDLPPTGELRSPRAAQLLAGAVEWRGDPELLAGTLADLGMIDRLHDGIRVRGMDRYKATWEKNRRRKPERTRPVTGENPPGLPETVRLPERTVPVPERQTQTQTQITELLPTEVVAPPLPKKPSGAAQEYAGWVDERRASANPLLPASTLRKDQWARLGEALKAHGRKILEAAWLRFEATPYAQENGFPLHTFLAQVGDWISKALAVPAATARASDGVARQEVATKPIPATDAGKAWEAGLSRLRTNGSTYVADQLAGCLTPREVRAGKLVLAGDKFAVGWAEETCAWVLAELDAELVTEAGAA